MLKKSLFVIVLVLVPVSSGLYSGTAVTNISSTSNHSSLYLYVHGGYMRSLLAPNEQMRNDLVSEMFGKITISYQDASIIEDEDLFRGIYAELLFGPENSFFMAGAGIDFGFKVFKLNFGVGYCFSGIFQEVVQDNVHGSSLSLGMTVDLIQRRDIGLSAGAKYYFIQGNKNVVFLDTHLGLSVYLASEIENDALVSTSRPNRIHLVIGLEAIWYGANSQAGGDHFGLGASGQINYSLTTCLHIGPYFGLGYISADKDSSFSSVMGKILVPLSFGFTIDFNEHFFYRSKRISHARELWMYQKRYPYAETGMLATPYLMVAPGGFFVQDFRGGESIASSVFVPGCVFKIGVKHSHCIGTFGYHLALYVPFAKADPMLLLGVDL